MTGFWDNPDDSEPESADFWDTPPTPDDPAASDSDLDFWTGPEADLGRTWRLRRYCAPLLDSLRRHRLEVRRESQAEKARRQQIRAEECARALTPKGRRLSPGVVRAMLAMVQADEADATRDDRPEKPVGQRAVLKPKPPKPVAKRNVSHKSHTSGPPDQEGLF